MICSICGNELTEEEIASLQSEVSSEVCCNMCIYNELGGEHIGEFMEEYDTDQEDFSENNY